MRILSHTRIYVCIVYVINACTKYNKIHINYWIDENISGKLSPNFFDAPPMRTTYIQQPFGGVTHLINNQLNLQQRCFWRSYRHSTIIGNDDHWALNPIFNRFTLQVWSSQSSELVKKKFNVRYLTNTRREHEPYIFS